MLVLTRLEKESLQIGDNITITIIRVGGGKVRLGIEAPKETLILRGELVDRARRTKPESAA